MRHVTCRPAVAVATVYAPEVTQKVYFDVKVGDQAPERIIMGLYGTHLTIALVTHNQVT